ncbi:uncharacterized protein TNCV_3165871 [Trichonephila clavipes]|uniref:Uncharacterized protein n=1 Tax=Trichonephila clavipes TaxID=2585209 RepID=A0A8X6RFJ5_TRICX|nr:uncharacterized protein TNCV_3165871 [Trichonephila clavipes]
MTLHSPTENSLAVLNHKILEANSQVQNVKLGGHLTCLSINRLWYELCDMLRRLVGTTAPGHNVVQFRNEKVSNHGSIAITIDCNFVAFIVFEECIGGGVSYVTVPRLCHIHAYKIRHDKGLEVRLSLSAASKTIHVIDVLARFLPNFVGVYSVEALPPASREDL